MSVYLAVLLLILSVCIASNGTSMDVRAQSTTSPDRLQIARSHAPPHEKPGPLPDQPSARTTPKHVLPCISDNVAGAIFNHLTEITQRPEIQEYHHTEAVQRILYETAYLTSFQCALSLDLLSRAEDEKPGGANEKGHTLKETVCDKQAHWIIIEERFQSLREQVDVLRQAVEDDHFSVNVISHRGNPALADKFSKARSGNTLNQLAKQRSHLIPLIDVTEHLVTAALEESKSLSNDMRQAYLNMKDVSMQPDTERPSFH